MSKFLTEESDCGSSLVRKGRSKSAQLGSQVFHLSDAQMNSLTPHRPHATKPIPNSVPHRLSGSSSVLLNQSSTTISIAGISMQTPFFYSSSPRQKLPANLHDSMFSSSSLLFPPKSPSRQPSWSSSISMEGSSHDDSDSEGSSQNQINPRSPPLQVSIPKTIKTAQLARVVLSYAQASSLSPSGLRRVVSAPAMDHHHNLSSSGSHHHWKLCKSTTMLDEELAQDRWNNSSSGEFRIATRRELVNSAALLSDHDDDIAYHHIVLRNIVKLPVPSYSSRVSCVDVAVPVPRRQPSAESSDCKYFHHLGHTSSTASGNCCSGSGRHHHRRHHHHHQRQQQARRESYSLHEPIHALSVSQELGESYQPEYNVDYATGGCNIPSSTLLSTMALLSSHSRSMPSLPQRLTSTYSHMECNQAQVRDPQDEQGMHVDASEPEENEDAKVQFTLVWPGNMKQDADSICATKPQFVKSFKTEAVDSTKDSTSGWSGEWSSPMNTCISPPTRDEGRFVDLYKATSLPNLNCPLKVPESSAVCRLKHRGGILSFVVRRLVQRSRSTSP
jgi:hypothetical protein